MIVKQKPQKEITISNKEKKAMFLLEGYVDLENKIAISFTEIETFSFLSKKTVITYYLIELFEKTYRVLGKFENLENANFAFVNYVSMRNFVNAFQNRKKFDIDNFVKSMHTKINAEDDQAVVAAKQGLNKFSKNVIVIIED